MEIDIRFEEPSVDVGPVIIVPLMDGEELDGPPELLDEALDGYLGDRLTAGDITGKAKEIQVLFPERHAGPARVLVMGLGKPDDLEAESIRRSAALAARRISKMGVGSAAIVIPESAGIFKAPDLVRFFIDGIGMAQYRWEGIHTDGQKDNSKDEEEKHTPLNKLVVIVPAADGHRDELEGEAIFRQAVHAGVKTARDLSNTPPNHATPVKFAEKAKAMAHEVGLSLDVLDKKAIEKLNMGALLGVSQGSMEEPRYLIFDHNPEGARETICLVGKGVTFDSGGISIKPSSGMEEMKFDKSGACAVVGAMQAIKLMDLQIRVVGLCPLTENLPSGTAIKPADVLTASDGTTIEIISTDAEGRLILADALVHAATFEPACVVDLATLTGACVVALGNWRAGLFTNDNGLAEELLSAGARSGERVWRMPLDADYRDQLKTDSADLKNSGGRWAGAVTAAKFLEHFTHDKYPWAHLDIAGTAWRTTEAEPLIGKGATGFGVRLLCDWLKERSS